MLHNPAKSFLRSMKHQSNVAERKNEVLRKPKVQSLKPNQELCKRLTNTPHPCPHTFVFFWSLVFFPAFNLSNILMLRHTMIFSITVCVHLCGNCLGSVRFRLITCFLLCNTWSELISSYLSNTWPKSLKRFWNWRRAVYFASLLLKHSVSGNWKIYSTNYRICVCFTCTTQQ